MGTSEKNNRLGRYICRIRDELCIRKAKVFTGQEECFFFREEEKNLTGVVVCNLYTSHPNVY